MKVFASILATVCLLSACSGSSESTSGQTPAAGGSAPAQTASSGPATVPACETYLTKLEQCINTKVPAEQRDVVKAGLDQARQAWAGLDQAALTAACTAALDAAKTSYAAMGCEF